MSKIELSDLPIARPVVLYPETAASGYVRIRTLNEISFGYISPGLTATGSTANTTLFSVPKPPVDSA